MFTGLVERTGKVISAQDGTSGNPVRTLVVDPGNDFAREHGASVAINGVCLTEVGTKSEGPLTFHVSHETIAKTSLANIKAGDLVNLERAMRPTDRLGGHIVLGHVDGTGTITNIANEGAFWLVQLTISRALARYVISKGSIAIDGVSLTVNEVKDDAKTTTLSFMLIPTTWMTTRFHTAKPGDLVNIEVDMIAKHVERLVSMRTNDLA